MSIHMYSDVVRAYNTFTLKDVTGTMQVLKTKGNSESKSSSDWYLQGRKILQYAGFRRTSSTGQWSFSCNVQGELTLHG